MSQEDVKKKKKDGKLSIAIVMPSKIRPENRYSTLLSKVNSYIQAVEEDEDSQYHLRYLRSLKNQIEGKIEKAENTNGNVSAELQTIYEILEAFLPYHERG